MMTFVRALDINTVLVSYFYTEVYFFPVLFFPCGIPCKPVGISVKQLLFHKNRQ